MLDTWKVFCMTGSVDTYLLMKQLEFNEQNMGWHEQNEEEDAEIMLDPPSQD